MKGTIDGKRIALALSQRPGAREATGSFTFDGFPEVKRFGVLQVAENWASVTFESAGHAMRITLDKADPKNPGAATVALHSDGQEVQRGTLPSSAVVLR